MDRYYLEKSDLIIPDKETEDQRLIARTGDEHEQAILTELELSGQRIVKIERTNFAESIAKTISAFIERPTIIYQAALADDRFAGYADFLILSEDGLYQLWDTKLARSPKPYYAVQLCCYSEMYAATTGEPVPERFGVILGSGQRVEFRTEDFIHYYRRVRDRFVDMQDNFTGQLTDRPEPLPSANHGRWASYANKYFADSDHLVQVAGITSGQIKKLLIGGISSMEQLGSATEKAIPKLAHETLIKLINQARLQCGTRRDRLLEADAPARFELIEKAPGSTALSGLEMLCRKDSVDVFFDMEGYPLTLGGLEYLFGASTYDRSFFDWWGHDRAGEKLAFEGFVDWVHARWTGNPEMHIYHYAAYEESALRRLSTRHDTRQDEVDDLLRNGVLVDLYKVIRQGLRIGEGSYSIKYVEHLYRARRSTSVATAVDSIVQYARWIESGQGKTWEGSDILKGIRDYNEDDCFSTEELLHWLRKVAAENGISPRMKVNAVVSDEQASTKQEVQDRLMVIQGLRETGDPVSLVLGDLLDFHRREQKPGWWRMFDRAEARGEELRDDPSCLHGLIATGAPVTEKQSQVQQYKFDGEQECKLDAGKKVKFCHNLAAEFTIVTLDEPSGLIRLKLSTKKLDATFDGRFPQEGSLIISDFISAKEIQAALCSIGQSQLSGHLPSAISSLLQRTPPALIIQHTNEDTITAGIRVTSEMSGGCLVIQGPPGTGKTYTAARIIAALLSAGKKVGVASNSHRAIINLLAECGNVVRGEKKVLQGIKVGGDLDEEFHGKNPCMKHEKSGKDAAAAYTGGLIGGTAWLFSLTEMEHTLDYLFIDEAGQVSLANAVAMARSAENLILLGDQMQLEQPIQGSHPGDSGMSSLQYALKHTILSLPDAPIYHAVVPADYGLFLGESRRMHPAVCKFISESIYEGRLIAHADCDKQRIDPGASPRLITHGNGVIFIGVEHDGNIQQSDEEADKVIEVYKELLGRTMTASDGSTKSVGLEDFLFISPYNAQVRALKNRLPEGARIGSVDKFQGQEAPICILSLCSSFGEYGSRGLSFILDKNRLNVAISRARCLAIVIADPRISQTSAGSLGEMSLINLFCKLAFQG